MRTKAACRGAAWMSLPTGTASAPAATATAPAVLSAISQSLSRTSGVPDTPHVFLWRGTIHLAPAQTQGVIESRTGNSDIRASGDRSRPTESGLAYLGQHKTQALR